MYFFSSTDGLQPAKRDNKKCSPIVSAVSGHLTLRANKVRYDDEDDALLDCSTVRLGAAMAPLCPSREHF